MPKNIITHPGTGTEIVEEICAELGANLKIVTTLKQARKTHFDGVILLGGADIDPRFYGQQKTHTWGCDHGRDAIEWYLVRQAFNRNLPTLGICRGHQMLAVAAGGSLWQDITVQGATKKHYSAHELVSVCNPLEDSIPPFPFSDTDYKVNSYHHQAVRRVPFGFSVQAYSPDGIIEAIYSQNKTAGYLGVQFHPELLYPHNPQWLDFFSWFVRDGLRY